jgi:hypothetical protein
MGATRGASDMAEGGTLDSTTRTFQSNLLLVKFHLKVTSAARKFRQ